MRTVLLGATSLVLVVSSLGIDQTANDRAEARHLGFGYPLHFASSNFTSSYTPPAYPQTYRLNPWEIPVDGNPGALLVPWALVYGALLGCWLLLRMAFGHASDRDARLPPAST